MHAQMLASLVLFHPLLTLIFISVCLLLPWLMKVEKRQINYPQTVIESAFGKLRKMSDRTKSKMILHIKHSLKDKQSCDLRMLLDPCI